MLSKQELLGNPKTVLTDLNWSRTLINSPESILALPFPAPRLQEVTSVSAFSAVKWVLRIKPEDIYKVAAFISNTNQ